MGKIKDTFPDQYNAQKIPEWYQQYIDYHALIKMINDFHHKEGEGQVKKLPGVYYYSAKLKKMVRLKFDVESKIIRGTPRGTTPEETPVTRSASLNKNELRKEFTCDEMTVTITGEQVDHPLDPDDQETFNNLKDQLEYCYGTNKDVLMDMFKVTPLKSEFGTVCQAIDEQVNQKAVQKFSDKFMEKYNLKNLKKTG